MFLLLVISSLSFLSSAFMLLPLTYYITFAILILLLFIIPFLPLLCFSSAFSYLYYLWYYYVSSTYIPSLSFLRLLALTFPMSSSLPVFIDRIASTPIFQCLRGPG